MANTITLLADFAPQEASVPSPALLPKPVKGFETPHPQDGHRFGSRVFTLINTVTKHEFFAHEYVLSQSPVLMQACREHKGSLRLKLPADVEDREFRQVLEYLYTGKLDSPAHYVQQGGMFLVQGLVELYVLASRLGLGVLMALIVRELEKQDFLKSNPDVLFITAERIYPATPKSDRAFKDFFIAALTSCYENCEDFPEEQAAKLSMAGGPLALDIYQAQRAMNLELRAEVRAAARERRRY
ncbi:hypothetical protein MMC30_002889 [Trapelia coarctata]|nr:hypothetical protein [Trapelia coarctata]